MDLFLSIVKIIFFEKVEFTIRIILFIVLSPLLTYVFIKHLLHFKNELVYLKHLNTIMPTWPVTDGTVLESLVKEGFTGGTDGIEYKYFHVMYNYVVDNKEYTSTVYKLLEPMIPPEQKCKELAAEYYPGRKISVYYNPEKPEECCLVQADSKDVKSELSIFKSYSIFFVFMGVIFTWLFLSFVWMTLIAIIVIGFLFIRSNTVIWEYAVNKVPFIRKFDIYKNV